MSQNLAKTSMNKEKSIDHGVSSTRGCIYNADLAPKAQGTSKKWKWKHCESQSIRDSDVRWCCLKLIRGTLSTIPQQYGCLNKAMAITI